LVNQNIGRGLLLAAVALLFLVQAPKLTIGSLSRPGPGLFPVMVASLLFFIAIVIVVRSRFLESVPLDFHFRNIALVAASIAALLLCEWRYPPPQISLFSEQRSALSPINSRRCRTTAACRKLSTVGADIDSLEEQIANSIDLPDSIARRSIDYGQTVGAAVYQTSRDDGEDRSYLTNFPADYVPPVCDGCWVPTAPGQRALQPYWKENMTPFVLTPGDCGMDGPPAFSTDPTSDAYQEAYEIYKLKNNITPEQATIAGFWADGPGTINGPGHSLSTTSQILSLVGANLAQAAETYARVGLAVSDGIFAVWWSKYTYNWIRPITYINRYIDANWTTLLGTPPFPEYTSAHSGQTGAALNTLIELWGDIAYVDHTHDNDGYAPRSFASLTDSMAEAALSRMYAGIHFRSAVFEGIDQGRCVATKVNALPWYH